LFILESTQPCPSEANQFPLHRDEMNRIKKMLHTLVDVVQDALTVELYFPQKSEKPSFLAIEKLVHSMYNLFEPNLSNNYPLKRVTFTLPQIFGNEGEALSSDNYDAITYVSKSNFITELLENRSKKGLKKLEEVNIEHEVLNQLDCEDIEEISKTVSIEEFKEKFKSTKEYNIHQFKCTLLGGTFDHLHSGHKILITSALLLTSQRLIVGVTSEELLKKKNYASFIEHYDIRVAKLRHFVHTISPSITLEVFPLSDPVGIAATREDAEALLLTLETLKGGDLVNKARMQNNISPVELVFAGMIYSKKGNEEDFSNKTSSSQIRAYLDDKSNQSANDLYIEWKGLLSEWKNCKQAESSIEKWWSIMRDMYSENWRYYHTLNHIKELFNEFYKVKALVKNEKVFKLSVWFHDVVYIPRNSNNEEKSAELFEAFYEENKEYIDITEAQKDAVVRIILGTKNHKPKLDSTNELYEDEKLFLDADLSILGQAEEKYARYANNIRKEYIFVPEQLFKVKRVEVLKSLSENEHIYFTQVFRDLYESQARSNIKHEIGILSADK